MIAPLELAAVMLLATTVRSTFGFGEALVAVPLLAFWIPIDVAAPVAVLASITVALIIVIQDWRHIHFGSAGRLVLSTLFGIPLGLLLLKSAHESVVKCILGSLILAFSAYSLMRRKGALFQSDRYAWFFGFVAGICGGAYGLNGPPLAVYGSFRGWTPQKFRATLQGYFLPASIVGMCGYGFTGLWTPTVTDLFLKSVPSVVIGTIAGRLINRRLDPRRFARYVYFGLGAVGCALLYQAIVMTSLI